MYIDAVCSTHFLIYCYEFVLCKYFNGLFVDVVLSCEVDLCELECVCPSFSVCVLMTAADGTGQDGMD